jgi:hypothetical protein
VEVPEIGELGVDVMAIEADIRSAGEVARMFETGGGEVRVARSAGE